MDRNLLTIGCALCFTTCGLASVAHAAEQAPTVFEDVSALKLQPVDDTVLANQTGKGIVGDIISGVVITLLSQWQLPNGATAVASGLARHRYKHAQPVERPVQFIGLRDRSER